MSFDFPECRNARTSWHAPTLAPTEEATKNTNAYPVFGLPPSPTSTDASAKETGKFWMRLPDSPDNSQSAEPHDTSPSFGAGLSAEAHGLLAGVHYLDSFFPDGDDTEGCAPNDASPSQDWPFLRAADFTTMPILDGEVNTNSRSTFFGPFACGGEDGPTINQIPDACRMFAPPSTNSSNTMVLHHDGKCSNPSQSGKPLSSMICHMGHTIEQQDNSLAVPPLPILNSDESQTESELGKSIEMGTNNSEREYSWLNPDGSLNWSWSWSNQAGLIEPAQSKSGMRGQASPPQHPSRPKNTGRQRKVSFRTRAKDL